MSKMKRITELLAICALSGTIITNVPLFSLPTTNVLAKARVTTTKGGISVYNADNLKSGDHYIPEGTTVHYKHTKEGIQVWSNSKLPTYDHNYKKYLRHGKHYKYIVTYKSLNNLGISPLTKKKKDHYKKHQKKINHQMKQLFHKGSKQAPIDYGPSGKGATKHHKKSNTHKPHKKHNTQQNKKAQAKKRADAKRRHKKAVARQRAKMRALKHQYDRGKKDRPTSQTNKPHASPQGANKPQGKTLPHTGDHISFFHAIMKLF